MAISTVSTQSATSVDKTTATGNGNITATGGINPTIRGFELGTTQTVDRTISETGSFSTGAYTLPFTSLTAGQLYYYRAFATNTDGTGYGLWTSFTTVAPTYSVKINAVDRTADVLNQTIQVSDILNDQQNTCTLSLIDRSGNGIPSTDQEIIITMNDGSILFGGYVIGINITKRETGKVQANLTCVDYSRLLDRNLVNASYTNQTDAQIINSIVNTYCPGFGITTTNVISGVTIDQINFNYIQPSQALRRIADLTGRNWYIDYNKDIHYFPTATTATPFNILDAVPAKDYTNLVINKDASQIKNRVYVRGGTYLSDPTTYSVKGDGVSRQFVLPDKPHDTSMTVNGIAKTIGIKNINTSGFDYYLNYQEKYLEQDASLAILATTDTLVLTYTYDIPVLVAVENTASIISNGQKEFAIFDKTISTQVAARDRASAELTDYATNIIEGSFSTRTAGFRSGEYININLTDYGVNADYIVTQVSARAYGAGYYEYDVQLASAKTMGIIRFLIELLEANNKLVELNDDEVVDNLLSVADSLMSDSLTDALTIDSAGAYATWCTDSLQAVPTTRARWDLYQW